MRGRTLFTFFRISGDELDWDGEIPDAVRRLAETIFDFIETENPDIAVSAQYCVDSMKFALTPFWVKTGDAGRELAITLVPPEGFRSATLDDLDETNFLVDAVGNVVAALVTSAWPPEDLTGYPEIQIPKLRDGELMCAYALWRLDQALAHPSSTDNLLAATAIAGRILALAALRLGAKDAEATIHPELGRKGADQRWAALNEIKREVRGKWQADTSRKKAEFIRKIKDSVLTDPRAATYGLINTNIERTIRTWLGPRQLTTN